MKHILLTCLILASFSNMQSQNNPVIIDNGVIKREISCENNQISSTSYTLSKNNTKFLASGSKEFTVSVNDKAYSGQSKWKNIIRRDTSDNKGGKGVIVSFESTSEQKFSIELIYMTYPNLPVVRKALKVINKEQDDIKIENVDVESFRLNWYSTEAWIYRQYARYKHLGPYVGDWNDPLLIVHSLDRYKGIAFGNETVGVIKRTAVFQEDGYDVATGLTHTGQDFAFRKWINPGESWQSPWVFTTLYDNTSDPYQVINTSVQDFVRRHMDIRIEKLDKKPMFVYNTWDPFGQNIDDKMVRELAKAASECGIEEFIIDDGWQLNIDLLDGKPQYYGDWEVDKKKFPNGLKPVFDYIKSLGMKPGLWISLAASDPSSKVYKNHPEYFVTDKNGKPTNLYNYGDSRTACMGTDWYDYIKKVILRLVNEHGLSYVKIDFSIVTSAYMFDNERTGCYATDHPHHKDHNESFGALYDRCMQLFDDLHREAPELFIDCTYETAGKLQLIDYGIAKHAEGDWLSNVATGLFGAMRVRNLAWGRSPAIPATTLVLGNMNMNDEYHQLAFKSLTGTLPIMLGDPRKLSATERAWYRSYASWLKKLEQHHAYMSYRQDLPGFGEPQDGSWDGFCRLNTETKSGGLVGVFRHGSKEKSRIVTIPWLDPDTKYTVKQGPEGKLIATMLGTELAEKGFVVNLPKDYDGELFEITTIK